MGRYLRQWTMETCKVRNPTIREIFYSDWYPDSITTGEAQQNRNPAASAEAKSTLRGMIKSQNAYPPLKSIAEYLCFILDNCEVWPPSHTYGPRRLLPL